MFSAERVWPIRGREAAQTGAGQTGNVRATLTAIREKLYQRRHESVPMVGAWLQRVPNGYFAYHAVPTNVWRLNGFRTEVCRAWRHAWLRRSQRHRLNSTQLVSIQSTHPQIHPVMPGAASLSGEALLCVTSNLRQEPYAKCGREKYVAPSEQLPWNERADCPGRHIRTLAKDPSKMSSVPDPLASAGLSCPHW